MHGFGDTLENAFVAVIYSRVTARNHHNYSNCKNESRTIEKQTLPRLKLAGAVLLSRLMSDTIKALELPNISTYYWCDSMITLAWIQKEPLTWRTFVADRVAEIQKLTNRCNWNYIKSADNTASRGSSPLKLKSDTQWWTLPELVNMASKNWPINQHPIAPTDFENER